MRLLKLSIMNKIVLQAEGMEVSDEGLITWIPLEGALTSGLVSIYIYDDENENSLSDFQNGSKCWIMKIKILPNRLCWINRPRKWTYLDELMCLDNFIFF